MVTYKWIFHMKTLTKWFQVQLASRIDEPNFKTRVNKADSNETLKDKLHQYANTSGTENRSAVVKNECNVYNTINEAELETQCNVYDTTEQNQKPNEHNQTYDTTENIPSRSRDPDAIHLYNTSVGDDDDADDGEYSHTGTEQMKYYKTDNIYGMKEQQRTLDKHGGKGDNAETYSHLNMRTRNKIKTDNVYGCNWYRCTSITIHVH